MRIKKKLVIAFALCAFAVFVALPLFCYLYVGYATKDRIYDDVESIPYREVGMVLGTGPTTAGGHPNSYFYYRLDAVCELYEAGKIRFILISGDNGRKGYSEPDSMKEYLVSRGIPPEVIYLDYAGFRTLDSMVRAKKVFGLSGMTVISQRFHNERSILLGDWAGMDLIAYNAKETTYKKHLLKIHIREGYARVKLFIDMMLDKKPKYLGPAIPIGDDLIQHDTN